MVNMKKFMPFLVILILFSIGVKAELEITQETIRDTILPTQTGLVYLKITNENFFDQVEVRYSDDFWRLKIEPRFINLPANEQQVVKIYLYPLNSAKPGDYVVNLIFWSITDFKVETEYTLKLKLMDPSKAINVELLDQKIDPRKKDFPLKIKFTNNYDIPIKDLKVEIKNRLFSLRKTFDFEPGEVKIEEFLINLDPSIKQGKYPVEFLFSMDNKPVARIDKEILISHLSEITKDIKKVNRIFSSVKEIVIMNGANTIAEEQYKEKFSKFERLFTLVKPRPNNILKEGNKYVYIWDINLEPLESYEIRIIKTYRGFLITIFGLLILIGLVYYWFGKEIEITKKVLTTRKEKDGISNFKILLNIKNKSKRPLYNVKILDKLPHLIKPLRDFGTLKPTSIKKTRAGIALIWNLPLLSKKEEIVISYKVESKLPIVGRFLLSTATAKYRNKHGRIVKSYSNKLILFSLPSLKK